MILISGAGIGSSIAGARDLGDGFRSDAGTTGKEREQKGRDRTVIVTQSSKISDHFKSDHFKPLTGNERFSYYLGHTFGPAAVLWSAAGAGIDQASDSQPEWGQGMEGYGKRLASRFGQHAVKRSIQDGAGALLHEDPRYFPSQRNGVWTRTGYAVTHSFLTRRDDGSTKFSDSHIIAAFGAGLISRLWCPGERIVWDGLKSGTISLGVDAAITVFKEFWPDIRRKLKH